MLFNLKVIELYIWEATLCDPFLIASFGITNLRILLFVQLDALEELL